MSITDDRRPPDTLLSHLLKYSEASSNHFYRLKVRYDLAFLHNDLVEASTAEIIRAIEGVEVIQRGKTAPFIERDNMATTCI